MVKRGEKWRKLAKEAKRGEKWGKEGKSWEKWLGVAICGFMWLIAVSCG